MPNFSPGLRTTDATQTEYPGGGPVIDADSVCRVPLFVFATDHNGDAAFWSVSPLIQRVGTGAPQVSGSPTKQATAGAALWAASFFVDGNSIKCHVTGVIGTTIDWLYTNDDAFCMVGPVV